MIKTGLKIEGKFKIRSYRAGTKELLRETPWIHNRIISGSGGYGRNLLLRQMHGDTTYAIEIDSASIGTDDTAPADSDTGLGASVLASIAVAQSNIADDELSFDFFIPDGDLADGDYKEFGLFMDGRLFARSLISPAHTKSTNEDTTISYLITFSAA